MLSASGIAGLGQCRSSRSICDDPQLPEAFLDRSLQVAVAHALRPHLGGDEDPLARRRRTRRGRRLPPPRWHSPARCRHACSRARAPPRRSARSSRRSAARCRGRAAGWPRRAPSTVGMAKRGRRHAHAPGASRLPIADRIRQQISIATLAILWRNAMRKAFPKRLWATATARAHWGGASFRAARSTVGADPQRPPRTEGRTWAQSPDREGER